MKVTCKSGNISEQELKSLPLAEIKRRLNGMMDITDDSAVGAALEVASVPVAVTAPGVGSIEDLMNEYGNDDLIIHERVIAGKCWGIKEHDMYSLLDLETRRLSVERGQIKRDPSREVKLGLAMELQTSLYKRGAGEKWEPFFKDLTECQSFLKKPRVKSLIDELASGIWEVNPSLDPMTKARAANAANE